MRFSIKSGLFSILSVLISSSYGFSQIKGVDYKYNPSCKETLKFKLSAFADSFAKNNKIILSEVETDQVFVYWSECKHQENVKRLIKYPILKARLLKLRDLFRALLTQDASFGSQLVGGGTMYNHMRNRQEAYIAETIGLLVDLTTSKSGAQTSLAIKARYQKAWTTINNRLKKIRAITPEDLQFTTKKIWFDTAKTYEKAIDDIKSIAGPKIDITSTTIFEFIAGFSWIDEWKPE